MMKTKFSLLFALFASLNADAQISITSLPYTPGTTHFDSYDPSVANGNSTLPAGWTATSSGSQSYRGRGTGTSNSGGYWGYGNTGEYSLGALRSATPGDITYAVSFTNNSGSTIQSLTISWDYEQCRFANNSGWECTGTGQLSGNATLNSKDFVGSATGTNGTVATTQVNSFNLTGLSISNGQSFGIQWMTTDSTNSDNGIGIDNFTISASSGAPLPILLLSFSGQQTGTVDRLVWTTACQSTVRQFLLERSDGHNDFSPVAFLDAQKDNCFQKQTYRFDVPVQAMPLRLYRLAMSEDAGLLVYSAVLRIAGPTPNSGVVLRPLPAKDQLYVEGLTPGSPWQIFNLLGQAVKQGSSGPDAIDIGDLSEGHYLFRHTLGSLRFEKR